MILLKTAQRIASEWHGGQWTDLYAFSSSGKFLTTKEGALEEIDDCLKSEKRKTLIAELTKLREFISNSF